MYLQYYGFQERPFSLLPDPDFLFPGCKHEAALTSLELAVANQSGFCVISGETGTGKTTLVRKLLNQLPETVCVGLISNTYDSFAELMGWILSAYDIKAESDEVAFMHSQFVDFVIEQYAGGRHTLLVIDEAQNLSVSALEQLRMLCNINSDNTLVLQIILVGQLELGETLCRPELKQFAQRISVDCRLGALDEQETIDYIGYRLGKAGGSNDLFDEAACRLAYRHSAGVPRSINRLCDLALIYGYAGQIDTIDASLIDEVARDRTLCKTGVIPRRITSRFARVKTGGKVSQEPPVASVLIPDAAGTVETQQPEQPEQPGARRMKKPLQPESSKENHGNAPENKRGLESAESPAKGAVILNELQPADALQAIAEKVIAEKVLADRLAAEKSAAAKAAVDKAAADMAIAEKAIAEKLAAEKAATEKIVAERQAARQAAVSKAAAEAAAKARKTVQQTVLEKEDTARVAEEKIAAEKLATDKIVSEKQASEQAAIAEATAAAAAAEKALAERIAAEKAALAVAAAVDTAVKKAVDERIAVERQAADRIAAVEASAMQAGKEQEQIRKIAEGKRMTEEAAIRKADSDAVQAEQAAAAKSAAQEVEVRMKDIVQQAKESAQASSNAADVALAEHLEAKKAATEKVTAEKIALANVAASVAATTRQAAEEAEVAKAAALKEATEKSAAAAKAAKIAVEASAAAQQAVQAQSGAGAEAVGVPESLEAGQTPHPMVALLVAAQPEDAAHGAKPAGNKYRNVFAVMTVAAVAAGVAWLVGGKPGTGESDDLAAVSSEAPSESGSFAAMEVKKTATDVNKPR